MPGTFLNYPFDQELFVQSWAETPDPVKTAMLNSGAMVQDSVIASRIQTEGNLYTIPFYNTLSGTPANYDGQTDIPTVETSGDSQTGIVYGRSQGFTARNFVAELSGSDPMTHISNSIAKYWDKYRQAQLIRILGSIFGITGASGFAKLWADNHTVDLGSETATAAKIGETDLNNLATQAMGDGKSAFSLAVMHSDVAKTLENLEVLEYWKQTDSNGLQRPISLASVNGYTVIVDDNVPVAATGGEGLNKDLLKYTTYLLGDGAIRTAKGRLDVPAEPVREAAKNGGQDTLYTRIRETIHPNGFSFKVPSSGWTESPTDGQLGAVANWAIKFNPKAIPIARIITNG